MHKPRQDTATSGMAMHMAMKAEVDTDKLIFDSGCTTHILHDKEFFINLKDDTTTVTNGDGSVQKAVGHGSAVYNLISIATLVKKGNRVNFSKHGAELDNGKEKAKLFQADTGNLYYLKIERVNAAKCFMTLEHWHRRYGHAAKLKDSTRKSNS